MPDITKECVDCREDWVYTVKEQERFAQLAEKGITEPKRCPPCRKAKRDLKREQYGDSRGNR